jgi:hypothetical protein
VAGQHRRGKHRKPAQPHRGLIAAVVAAAATIPIVLTPSPQEYSPPELTPWVPSSSSASAIVPVEATSAIAVATAAVDNPGSPPFPNPAPTAIPTGGESSVSPPVSPTLPPPAIPTPAPTEAPAVRVPAVTVARPRAIRIIPAAPRRIPSAAEGDDEHGHHDQRGDCRGHKSTCEGKGAR